MKRMILAVLALALALPALAVAGHKPGHGGGGGGGGGGGTPPAGAPGLSIAGNPNPVVFGTDAVISGTLKGTSQDAAQTIVLEATPFPYTAPFTVVTSKPTDAKGDYSFTVRPALATKYRVKSPTLTSGDLIQQVRLRVSFRLSDSTPFARRLVTFSGRVSPKHIGKVVKIQRRPIGGKSFVTVATSRTSAGTSTYSTYSRRLRIYRDAVYRVRVLPGDSDHLFGQSRTRLINVH